MNRYILTPLKRIEVCFHYIVDKNMISSLFCDSANDGPLFVKEHTDKIAQGMMRHFVIGFAIYIGIAQYSIGYAILGGIVTQIPFTGHLSDITGPLRAEPEILCDRELFGADTPIEGIASRGEYDFAHRSAGTASQDIQQAAHMYIGIRE